MSKSDSKISVPDILPELIRKDFKILFCDESKNSASAAGKIQPDVAGDLPKIGLNSTAVKIFIEMIIGMPDKTSIRNKALKRDKLKLKPKRTRRSQAKVSPETVFQIIQEAIVYNGVTEPEELKKDFFQHFDGLKPIDSYSKMNFKLCRQVKKLLDSNEDLKAKYAWLINKISGTVRLQIALLLGFQEASCKSPSDGSKKSNREILTNFISGLSPGATWTVADLEATAGGQAFVNRIHTQAVWSLDSVKIILGENAELLLERNPFVASRMNFPEKGRITSAVDARRALLVFLAELPPGKQWTPIELKKWKKNADGYKGYPIFHWIETNIPGGFCKENIRNLLGSEAEEFFAKNPFIEGNKIDCIEKAARYFVEFLDTLKTSEVWSPNVLREWEGSVKGFALYVWLWRNVKHNGSTDWFYILLYIVPSEYLTRNPFYHDRIAIKATLDQTALGAPSQRQGGSRHQIKPKKNFKLEFIEASPPTPEDLLIEHEESANVKAQQKTLQELILQLPKPERDLVEAFYREEEVDQQRLGKILIKMKTQLSKTRQC